MSKKRLLVSHNETTGKVNFMVRLKDVQAVVCVPEYNGTATIKLTLTSGLIHEVNVDADEVDGWMKDLEENM